MQLGVVVRLSAVLFLTGLAAGSFLAPRLEAGARGLSDAISNVDDTHAAQATIGQKTKKTQEVKSLRSQAPVVTAKAETKKAQALLQEATPKKALTLVQLSNLWHETAGDLGDGEYENEHDHEQTAEEEEDEEDKDEDEDEDDDDDEGEDETEDDRLARRYR